MEYKNNFVKTSGMVKKGEETEKREVRLSYKKTWGGEQVTIASGELNITIDAKSLKEVMGVK